MKLTFQNNYGVDNNTSVELTAPTTFMNGSVTNLFTIKGGEITGLTAEGKKQADIKIPAYSYITGIGASAFSNVQEHSYKTLNGGDCNTTLKSVTFEGNNIKTIGQGAFDGCTNLSSINLPSSLTSIGAYAFKQTALPSVEIPSSVTSIGERAFFKCNDMTTLGFTGSVSSLTLGEACFSCNNKLTTATLPEGLTTLPKWCLNYDNALTTINFPTTLTTIGDSAISENAKLANIDLSKTQITVIAQGAFNNDPDLANVQLPNTLTTIGMNEFFKCSILTSIDIPASVQTISELGAKPNAVGGAFTGCSKLATVNFLADQKGVKNAASSLVIGQNTFDGCAIKEITLPSNVTQIQTDAFMNCKQLKNITINSKTLSVQVLSFGNIGCGSGSLKITCAEDSVAQEINKVCKGHMSGCNQAECTSSQSTVTHSQVSSSTNNANKSENTKKDSPVAKK